MDKASTNQKTMTTGARELLLSLAFIWAVVPHEALSLAAFSGFFLIALGMLVLDGPALSAFLRLRKTQNI